MPAGWSCHWPRTRWRPARRLLAAGCEAVVVHFLHAYANPAHELRAGELVRRIWPNPYVTLGHQVTGEYREFERGTTAAVNACVQPVLHRYLGRLRGGLEERGFAAELLVMQGNGGTVSARVAAEEAAKTVMSGPASGVMAAAFLGARAGFPNLVTYDMGGTSTDVALVQGGIPAVTDELELEYGMPVHVPMVDVHTVGAGGGSIARVDAAGLLRVGPESAGAVPGPVCYGRGGTRPTITDANLVLGRLDPEGLLAVDRPVTLAAVAEVLAREIGTPLGLIGRRGGCGRAADRERPHGGRHPHGVARARPRPARLRPLRLRRRRPAARGRDRPRARHPDRLVPARPGITNAIGCAVADLRHDFTRTVNAPLEALAAERLATILAEQVEQGRSTLAREGVEVREVAVLHSADMQFRGQTHLLNVPVDGASLDPATLRGLFERAYLDRFGVELPEIGAVLVNLKSSVIGRRPEVDPALLAASPERGTRLDDARVGERRVWFEDGWAATPVYRRERLPLGVTIDGPAIIAQLDATTVLEPGCRARQDPLGNLVITLD